MTCSLKYDPESGAAYLQLRKRPILETTEIAPGVLMDLAEDGLPVGFDLTDAAAMIDGLPTEIARRDVELAAGQ